MSVHSRYRAGLWHPYEKPMYGVLLNPYHPLSRGLVAAWLFNEGGGNTVFDLSGYGNHGTLGGGTAAYCPVWTTGKLGSALSFDDDYVKVLDADILDITDRITLEVWMIPDVAQSGDIVAQPAGKYCYQLNYDHETPDFQGSFAIKSGSTWYNSDGPLSISNGVLHQFVGTYDGTHLKTFLDGIEKLSNNIGSVTIKIGTCPFLIGANPETEDSSTPVNFFNGTILLCRLWERALRPSEIWQLYTDPFCMFYHPLEAELLYAAAPPAGIVPQAMHHYRMLREV